MQPPLSTSLPLLLALALLPPADSPQDPILERAYAKALAAWKAKDYRRGIAWLEPVTSKLDKKPGAKKLRAALHFSQGWKEFKAQHLRKARHELEQAAFFAPGERNTWHSIGIVCMHLKDAPAAKVAFGRTLNIDPGHFSSLISLARLEYDSRRYPQARSYLERAKKIHPRYPDLLLLEAKCAQDKVLGVDLRSFSSTHFSIRFVGAVPKKERDSRQILTHLERSHRELKTILGKGPDKRIEVILYSERQFSRLHGVQDWMGAFYDGKVRIPLVSWRKQKAKVQELMRHELAHAFLEEGVPGASPWLHEGFAQWFQGRRSRGLSQVFRTTAPAGASALRTPFATVPDAEQVRRLYLQSLVLMEDLLASEGRQDLKRLIANISAGKGTYPEREDAALRKVLGDDLAGWLGSLAKRRAWAKPAR